MMRGPRRRNGVSTSTASSDTEEFAGFVHATAGHLYRTALLLTGDHHLAEDLTQTAYARVFASWRRVSRADNPAAYARRVLLNGFISHKRLRRNAEMPTSTLPDPLPGDRASDADHSTRIDLLAALQQLSPTDRAVLVARYWEDRSVSQTAADLGLTETAVRTRSKRALERLRPLVADIFPERTMP
jgi:RNA polymerase sigma-70 factor (sigma-E family)